MNDAPRPADPTPPLPKDPSAAPDTHSGDTGAPRTGPHEPAATEPAASELPAAVGRYRIEGEIARGGTGVVLRGHDAAGVPRPCRPCQPAHRLYIREVRPRRDCLSLFSHRSLEHLPRRA